MQSGDYLKHAFKNVAFDHAGTFYSAAKNGLIKYSEIPKLEKAYQESKKSVNVSREDLLKVLKSKRRPEKSFEPLYVSIDQSPLEIEQL